MQIGGADSSVSSSSMSGGGGGGQNHVPIIRVSQPGAPQDNMPIVSAEEVVVQEADISMPPTPLSSPSRDRRYRPNTKKSTSMQSFSDK